MGKRARRTFLELSRNPKGPILPNNFHPLVALTVLMTSPLPALALFPSRFLFLLPPFPFPLSRPSPCAQPTACYTLRVTDFT